MRKLIFIILLLTNICNMIGNNIPNKDNMLIRCSVSPIGLDSDLYLIQIDTIGNYSITLYNVNSIDTATFITDTKILDTKSFKLVIELVNSLKKIKYSPELKIEKGGWEIKIIINNKTYHTNYPNFKYPLFTEIIDILLKLSPIPIELRGFS